jgi:hypothetical protein
MKIEGISITPDRPKLGETLKITVKLHNDSTEPAYAMVNATLDRQAPSSPTSVQQARVRLEANESKDVLLFKMVVNERSKPGQYKVSAWLAGKRNDARKGEFEIKETEGFKKTF